MLPAQRSRSDSSLRWFNFSAIVSSVQAWIRQEIVDDDPWDVETLEPNLEPTHVRSTRKPNSCRSRL
jgi:hypothetical protein